MGLAIALTGLTFVAMALRLRNLGRVNAKL